MLVQFQTGFRIKVFEITPIVWKNSNNMHINRLVDCFIPREILSEYVDS